MDTADLRVSPPSLLAPTSPPSPASPPSSPAPAPPSSLSSRLCPLCLSDDVRRSHTRGLEYLGRYLLAYKHYRCRDCNHRWAQSEFDPSQDKLTLAIWAAIIFTCALSLLMLWS